MLIRDTFIALGVVLGACDDDLSESIDALAELVKEQVGPMRDVQESDIDPRTRDLLQLFVSATEAMVSRRAHPYVLVQ